MFPHSIFKFSTSHSNVFTVWEVLTIWFCTLPVVYTVCTVTVYSLSNYMCLSINLTSHLTTVWECKRTNMAWFSTFLPTRGISMSPPLELVWSFNRGELRTAYDPYKFFWFSQCRHWRGRKDYLLSSCWNLFLLHISTMCWVDVVMCCSSTTGESTVETVQFLEYSLTFIWICVDDF